MSPRELLLKLIAEAEAEYHAYYTRKVKLAERAPTTEAVNVIIESIQPKHEFFVDYLLKNGVQVREKSKRERTKYYRCPSCGFVHSEPFYTCSECGY